MYSVLPSCRLGLGGESVPLLLLLLAILFSEEITNCDHEGRRQNFIKLLNKQIAINLQPQCFELSKTFKAAGSIQEKKLVK